MRKIWRWIRAMIWPDWEAEEEVRAGAGIVAREGETVAASDGLRAIDLIGAGAVEELLGDESESGSWRLTPVAVWEYLHLLHWARGLSERLNELGSEGWEVIDFKYVAGSKHYAVLLKRCVGTVWRRTEVADSEGAN